MPALDATSASKRLIKPLVNPRLVDLNERKNSNSMPRMIECCDSMSEEVMRLQYSEVRHRAVSTRGCKHAHKVLGRSDDMIKQGLRLLPIKEDEETGNLHGVVETVSASSRQMISAHGHEQEGGSQNGHGARQGDNK